ncbi:MAG TPA: hypothetical protein VJU61_23140 [Polyangiaceae bacterium]|nr:hypothetical protein [Polyangiaceae bacterium]
MFSRLFAPVPLAGSLPRGQTPRGQLWCGRALGAGLLLALGLLGWFKGINFDESLALHSGWLALQGSDASPVLWSPWTLALGTLAHAFADPAIVLHLGRVLSVLWIAAGVCATARGRHPSYAALALLLACCFDPVLAHLVDFRYDASLLGASLWYWARLRDRERPLSFRAGLWLGFLATHQLKGLALAALLASFTLLARPQLKALRSTLAGAAAFFAAWVLASWALGQGSRLREGYVLFFELSRVSPPASPPLHGSLLAFVALGLISIGLTVWQWQKRRAQARAGVDAERRWASVQRELAQHALWLAFVGLVVAHPQLFAYHLTPIALSGSLVVASQLEQLWPARVGLLACLAAGSQLALAWTPHLGSVRVIERVTHTPLETTIRTLRAVRAAEQPGDRALDPSGVLYFLPPCQREWYVDVLFAEWVEQGRWMYSPLLPTCTWVLRTHRLSAIPARQLAALGAFELQRGSGGLLTSEAAHRHIEPLALGDSTPSTW